MFPTFVDYFRRQQDQEEPWGTNLDPEAEGVTVDIDREAAFKRLGIPPLPFLNEHDLHDAEVSAPEPDVFNSPAFQQTANRQLAEHLADMPERQDPSLLKRIGVALTAGLAGAAEGPTRGLRFGQEILDRPYDQALDQWKLKTVPLEREAGREDRFNELLERNQDRSAYRDYLKKRDQDKLLSGLSKDRSKQEERDQNRLDKEKDRESRSQDRRLDRESRERIASKRGQPKPKEKKLTEGDKKGLRQKAKALASIKPENAEVFAKASKDPKSLTVADKASMLLAIDEEYNKLLAKQEGK